MTNLEKKAVQDHLLNASGLGEKSIGRRAINVLFDLGELDFYLWNRDLVVDIRKGCMKLGLECKMRWDKIMLDDLALRHYYENVMGLTPEIQPEEKSYYQKRNEGKL